MPAKQRNSKGLKITEHAQSGQILDNEISNNKKSCYFWRARSRVLGAKAESPLHTTPPKVWANCLSHSFSPTSLGYPHPIEVTPLLGNKQGNLLLVFAPSSCGRSPSKASPEFLVWPLVHLYWLGKAKNPDQGHHAQWDRVYQRMAWTLLEWNPSFQVITMDQVSSQWG